MQEEIADESNCLPPRRHTPKEERKAHVEKWKKSGLTMSEYCRQNNMPLANLSEWKRALGKKAANFKPIQLISTAQENNQSTNVIEIIVDQQIKIRLQQLSDISLLLNIVKGLMRCS